MMIDAKGIMLIAGLLAIAGAMLGLIACAVWQAPLWYVPAGAVAFPLAVSAFFGIALMLAVLLFPNKHPGDPDA